MAIFKFSHACSDWRTFVFSCLNELLKKDYKIYEYLKIELYI